MSDYISRQMAIDAADRADYTLLAIEDVKKVTDEVVKELKLKKLPSIQPERWIPCSERLPEIGQSVLLSVGGMYSAEGCLREDGDWAQFRWDAIQRKDMVGAWKPLPEPYKGEQCQI